MAVSSTQVQFDSLFGLFTYLAVAVGIVVFSLLIYFIVKYREKPSSQQPDDTPILGKMPISRGHARSVVLTLSLSTLIIVPLIVGSFGAIDNINTDAIPGRTNTIWFYPQTTGNFTIQCFEFCGVGHYTMKGTLMVMSQAAYFSWYNSTVVH